jgi:stage V sporulation protein G
MEGRFVAMPARKKKDGSFQDIAHPINRDTRAYLERVVLEAYDEEVAKADGLAQTRTEQEIRR